MIFLILSLGVGISFANAQKPTDDQVKAAFVYNFAKFTEWPSDVMKGPDTPFVIGVFGDDNFYKTLKVAAEGKSVQGKPISVMRIDRIEDGQKCHMIYIGSSQEENLSYILKEMKNFHVLTVGDMSGFAKRGCMINFTRERDYIRFEINVNAAERSGIKMSSNLLKLAKIVE
jgi:hypothetical protein